MYMDFPSNIFVVQGKGTYMLYLQQKIHGKNFCALLKNRKSLAQRNFPRLQYGMMRIGHLFLEKILSLCN